MRHGDESITIVLCDCFDESITIVLCDCFFPKRCMNYVVGLICCPSGSSAVDCVFTNVKNMPRESLQHLNLYMELSELFRFVAKLQIHSFIQWRQPMISLIAMTNFNPYPPFSFGFSSCLQWMASHPQVPLTMTDILWSIFNALHHRRTHKHTRHENQLSKRQC